jgi:hypothetical protein
MQAREISEKALRVMNMERRIESRVSLNMMCALSTGSLRRPGAEYWSLTPYAWEGDAVHSKAN